MKRLVILISGRGSNMCAIAQNCDRGVLKNHAKICAVLSNRPQAAGLLKAQERSLYNKVLLSSGPSKNDFEPALMEELDKLHADFIVLAGFDRLLSANFIARYPQRIINIHPADPRLYRGLHAYKWAWKNRLTSTTVTVHRVDAGMDTGPILAQSQVDLRGVKSLQQVEQRGLDVEHRLYSQVLAKLCLAT